MIDWQVRVELTIACVVCSHLARGLRSVYIDLVLSLATESGNCHDPIVLSLTICLMVSFKTSPSHLSLSLNISSSNDPKFKLSIN